jgi:DnaJ-class molecular chaperone
MSDTDAALDDYPMEDEGWVKCHHCGGSGHTVEGWDCDFCDGTGELEI